MSAEQQAIENEQEEIVVIPPNDTLREKAIVDGSPNAALRRAVAAAEAAIGELSSEFDGWINTELTNLLETLDAIRQNGWDSTHGEQLFNIAHDLKGHATTFGYPAITEICDTLCNLLEKLPDINRLSLNVIEIFITSIKTIIEQCEQNDNNPKADAISLGLRQMAMKILQQELERDQAENAEAVKKTG